MPSTVRVAAAHVLNTIWSGARKLRTRAASRTKPADRAWGSLSNPGETCGGVSCALLSGLENVTAVVDSRRQAVARNFALRSVLRYAQRIFILEIRVPREYFCHRRNAFVMKDKKYRSAHKVCAQAVPV